MMFKKYWYSVFVFVAGLYVHQQYAGNGKLSKEPNQLGSPSKGTEDGVEEVQIINNPLYKKSVQEHVPQKKEWACFSCKICQDKKTNALWRPCGKETFMHWQCKSESYKFFKTPKYDMGLFFERNKSGFVPLSKAIFRARNAEERIDSCNIVNIIMHKVGQDAFDMLMLRDHAGCSAWMHAIYVGDPVMIGTMLSVVKKRINDPQAVWKMLTSQYSGGYDHCKLTPLMIAVRQKNIPVIKLLKQAAGDRFAEYRAMKGTTGKRKFPGNKMAIDFIGDESDICASEIARILSTENDQDEIKEYVREEAVFELEL